MANLIVLVDLAGPATFRRGGHCMFMLQWLHAFERLGHQVFFLEFLSPDSTDVGPSVIQYFHDTVRDWWHLDQSALILQQPTRSLCGLEIEAIRRIAAEADAVITLAAHYRREPYPMLENVRPRILIEQDPGYTHLWAAEGHPTAIYGVHDLYYTVGANIGSPRCALPTLGINWQPIWNPVILDWWQPRGDPERNRFTTVADWRSYGYLVYEGRILGPKAEEFRKFIQLPKLAGETLEIALNIDPEDPDRRCLREHGWEIENPEVTSRPAFYRQYVSGSAGEFSCTKGGYAGTRCGWFSDRSACYLAAGRPVILQATGFEDLLPTGEGLFAVSTVEEAAEAIKAVRKEYARHSAAAREIARAHLDSDKLVMRLLTEAGIRGRVDA
jgi:hypothetical protein